MNYLTILMVLSGLFLSTNVDKPNKLNFERLTEVDPEFVHFLSAFEKTDLPYEMGINDIEATADGLQNYNNELNKILIRHTSGKKDNLRTFSRLGPPIITPLKRFYPTEKTVAVCYAKNRFGIGSGVIMIAIFNLKGKLIRQIEALRNDDLKRYTTEPNLSMSVNNPERIETFRITEDALIHKTSYKKVWKKDLKQFGVVNNEIVRHELVGEEILQIKEDGSIVSLSKSNPLDIANIIIKP